jgi:fermentation-respiration switch protein FrsA (DUF1100 family)
MEESVELRHHCGVMIRMLLGSIAVIVGALLAFALFVWVVQRGMLFPHHLRVPDDRVAESIPDLERIDLATSQGRVEAWYLPPRGLAAGERAGAVIFGHGNAELIEDWPLHLDGFPELGLGLMLVEYPGYGRSEGAPSEKSIREAMLAGFDALVARPEIDPERIVLHGRSLGGGAVCTILGERPVAALILQSTFTSTTDFARQILRIPAFLIRDPFRNREAVAAYSGPVLIMHGLHDDIIPYTHGAALSEASARASLYSMECRHNDCPPSWPDFWREIGEFLSRHGLIGHVPDTRPTVLR